MALLGAWRRHVVRIVAEQALPDSDRSAWGAYDLVAAANLRSFLAARLAGLPETVPNAFTRALDDVDRTFVDNTEPDGSGLLYRLDDRIPHGGQWWWERVPRTGPIRREIDHLKRTLP